MSVGCSWVKDRPWKINKITTVHTPAAICWDLIGQPKFRENKVWRAKKNKKMTAPKQKPIIATFLNANTEKSTKIFGIAIPNTTVTTETWYRYAFHNFMLDMPDMAKNEGGLVKRRIERIWIPSPLGRHVKASKRFRHPLLRRENRSVRTTKTFGLLWNLGGDRLCCRAAARTELITKLARRLPLASSRTTGLRRVTSQDPAGFLLVEYWTT